MSERPNKKSFRPILERLEAMRLLSAGATGAAHAAVHAEAHQAAATMVEHAHGSDTASMVSSKAGGTTGAVPDVNQKPFFGFLVYRITNPDQYNNTLTPPFAQVLVQKTQPVPGHTYNVLQISVRNGTAQTFNASDGFMVKLSGQNHSTPILTGSETWKPGQVYVFYVLTHKYYPVANTVQDGFIFDLGGARSVAVPGPSGIFLRLPYKPATFAKTLDKIVAFGPGAQGGAGIPFGLPVTSINQLTSAKTRRNDFGGYF